MIDNERTSPFATLSSRSPYSWLRERDIDLLVCAELHATGKLVDLFTSRLGLSGAHFLWARVSHAELDGESDLVVAFGDNDGKFIAHVENKIAAAFQPNQMERYRARSSRWAAIAGVSRSVTVLLAPANYMGRPGAEGFEVQITYEEASTALRTDGDPRAVFLADALEAGIEAYRRGYVMTPDEPVSALMKRCWQIASENAPTLNFAEPGVKPAGGTWPSFPKAMGFLANDAKRVELIYKMERGQVDLQFRNTDVEVLTQRCQGILAHGMEVRPAGKSASIRVLIPAIDFARAAEEQVAAIHDGIDVCERVRVFFVEHRDLLLP